jgi:uncharacterized membrane protein YdjX (TVP38/TMEM64 family)
MIAPDPVAAATPVSRRAAILRFVVFALVVGAALAAVRFTPLRDYLTREALLQTLSSLRDAWWAPALLIAGYVVLAPVGLPMTPLIFAGGAIFGWAWGSLYNAIGLFLGAVSSFLLARSLGRDLIVQLLGKRLKKVQRLVSRHGFWALVRARFVPAPFALINFGAALAGVRLPVFALATAVGLAPTTILFTYFAAILADTAAGDRGGIVRTIFFALAGLLTLTLLPTLISAVRRWRRYRQILAQRSATRGTLR